MKLEGGINKERWTLWTPASVHINKSSGMGSSGNCLLRAFSHYSVPPPPPLGILWNKTLAECGKFIVTHKLRKGGVGCEGGRTKTRNRAGDGAFTKGGVLCTVSPLAHGKGEQRERTGHGCSFSNLLLPRYPCIYIVEWLGRASNEILNGPIRWDT